MFLFLLFTCQLTCCEYKLQEIHPKGYYLRLEDASVWKVDWFNAWNSWNWKKDDSISVYPDQTHLENLNADPCSKTIEARLCPPRETIPYRHFISEILDDGYSIKLDNGFIWDADWLTLYSPKKIKGWQKGDEVTLSFGIKGRDGERIFYQLTNVRTFEMTFVRNNCHVDQWLNYLTVEKVEQCKWVTLNDGSLWEIYEGANWDKGDRVMIYPYDDLVRSTAYILINEDYVSRGYFRTPVVRAWLRSLSN